MKPLNDILFILFINFLFQWVILLTSSGFVCPKAIRIIYAAHELKSPMHKYLFYSRERKPVWKQGIKQQLCGKTRKYPNRMYKVAIILLAFEKTVYNCMGKSGAA